MAASADPRGPFDQEADGFLLGEGGYAMLLERDGHGDSRGPDGYGEILGVGAGSADVALNQWPSDPAPIARTMRAALADAAVEPREVAAVFASANGAPALDRVEAHALGGVFPPPGPLITSIKGAIGESGASGAAAVAAALLCGGANLVPPVARLVVPSADAAPLRLVQTPTALPGPIVLVNAIASGGSLFSVVIRIPA
jgi:3-oxoacyl-(acyl-carrier-protein) synthase